MAATVKRPRGGSPVFFDTNLKACLKLQNVSGNRGETRRILIAIFLCNKRGNGERDGP
jgi:hypothetical protein